MPKLLELLSEDDDLLDLLAAREANRIRAIGPCARSRVGPQPLATQDPVEDDGPVSWEKAPQDNHPAEGQRRDNDRYRPLNSVWYGDEDAELIEQLLEFYPHQKPSLILDATVNSGRFWRDSSRPIIGLDIDPRHKPHVCADNAAIPFLSGIFDVVVYDPPHIPNQGRDRSKDFNTRFGLGARSRKENGYTFAHTYPSFMVEAWRVLAEDGLLLCKITDYVHNHRYQWAHVELIQAGREAGFTACDCVIKVRKGPIVDPKWKTAHHTRRQHCYWIVFRKSERCE
jgi:hypothetical protein